MTKFCILFNVLKLNKWCPVAGKCVKIPGIVTVSGLRLCQAVTCFVYIFTASNTVVQLCCHYCGHDGHKCSKYKSKVAEKIQAVQIVVTASGGQASRAMVLG